MSDSKNTAQSIISISIAGRRELDPTAPVFPFLLPVTLSWASYKLKFHLDRFGEIKNSKTKRKRGGKTIEGELERGLSRLGPAEVWL